MQNTASPSAAEAGRRPSSGCFLGSDAARGVQSTHRTVFSRTHLPTPFPFHLLSRNERRCLTVGSYRPLTYQPHAVPSCPVRPSAGCHGLELFGGTLATCSCLPVLSCVTCLPSSCFSAPLLQKFLSCALRSDPTLWEPQNHS